MQREIRVGSITWLNGVPTPLCFAGPREALEPAWVPWIYRLLKATSNPAPPPEVADFGQFQAGRQYRALTYCHCRADLDDATGRLTAFEVLEAVHDPGWTPPFRYTEFPPSLVPALFADPDLRDPTWYPGEASALSQVRAGERHKNSSLGEVPEAEQVLLSALIKCRAGAHPDDVGIRLGSPFHAPWVWNEWLLTYAPGQFKLYLRASKFPSHAWYVNGRQAAIAAGIGDASFPEVSAPPVAGSEVRSSVRINVPCLILYPHFLSRGAAASDPQAPNGAAERERRGPVATHPNTAPGWPVRVLTLGSGRAAAKPPEPEEVR